MSVECWDSVTPSYRREEEDEIQSRASVFSPSTSCLALEHGTPLLGLGVEDDAEHGDGVPHHTGAYTRSLLSST
jgi:hypothetical protein